jgi:hypothetical protein
MAAWSLLHGFSTLWLNDAVNAWVKATDPMVTIERIVTMLFEGGRAATAPAPASVLRR